MTIPGIRRTLQTILRVNSVGVGLRRRYFGLHFRFLRAPMALDWWVFVYRWKTGERLWENLVRKSVLFEREGCYPWGKLFFSCALIPGWIMMCEKCVFVFTCWNFSQWFVDIAEFEYELENELDYRLARNNIVMKYFPLIF